MGEVSFGKEGPVNQIQGRCPWLWRLDGAEDLVVEGPEGLGIRRRMEARIEANRAQERPRPSDLDLLRPQKADYPAKPLELTSQIPNSASLSQ